MGGCAGEHGPLGDASILKDQSTYFQELTAAVTAASKGQTPEAVQAAIPALRAELSKKSQIARYVGDGFAAQVGKVYSELTGLTLPDRGAEAQAARTHVAWHHGHAHGSAAQRPN